jgi:hypothetical protein
LTIPDFILKFLYNFITLLTMNVFIQNMGGSIFSLDLSQITNADYMFTSEPGEFGLIGWALLLALLGLGFSAFALWYFKKRRQRIELEKGQRMIVRRHAKISLVLFALFLVYVLARSLEVAVISMRFIGYILLLTTLINKIVAIILVKKALPLETSAGEIDSSIDYGRYLPRKKRK